MFSQVLINKAINCNPHDLTTNSHSMLMCDVQCQMSNSELLYWCWWNVILRIISCYSLKNIFSSNTWVLLSCLVVSRWLLSVTFRLSSVRCVPWLCFAMIRVICLRTTGFVLLNKDWYSRYIATRSNVCMVNSYWLL